MHYFTRVRKATEEANRRAILAELPTGRGGSLLDLGTHDGRFTVRLAARLGAERVAGLELVEEHALEARSRGIEVRTGDLDRGIPFADREFDVVHSNQVI